MGLVFRSDVSGVDPTALRVAIQDELQRYVVPVGPDDPLAAGGSRISVDLRMARGELSVGYDEPGRRPLVRVIPIPATPEATIRTVAWLVGNLVRDQAADLVPASPPRAVVPAAPPSDDPAVVVAQPLPVRRHEAFVTASFFFPLATNLNEPNIRTHLSFNLIYGRVGMLDRGLQVGTANAVLGPVDGGQLGLLFNLATGDVHGLQLAGGVNVATGNVRGLQASFGVNRTTGDVTGVQMATVNATRGHVRGAQAGFVNTAGDVDGLQIGLVNVGNQVRGVQVGLVNVSDDIEGVPIGLINVSRTGGVHPAIWTSGTTQLAAGVKFATRNVYTLFSGATHDDGGLRLYGPGLALGVRLPIWRLILETDVGGSYLFGGPMTGVSRQEGMRDDIALASWRATANVQLHRRLTLFAGAAVTTRLRFFQSPVRDVGYEVGPDLFAGVQL